MSKHLFKKGDDPRRCKKPTGRPKGSKNKKHADDFRGMISELLDENWSRIQKGVKAMDDEAYARFAVQYLIRLIVPVPTEDYLRLSDADFDELIERIKKREDLYYEKT